MGFEERVARYVGGDLPVDQALAVREHLRGCADCEELARGFEEDRLWLASRPQEVAEVDFAAMRAGIRAKVSQAPSRWSWVPALLAAAGIVLVVGVGMSRRTPQPPAEIAKVTPIRVTPAPARTVVHRPHGVRHATIAQPQPDLTLEAAIRMFHQLEPEPPPPPTGSDSPVEMRISTLNPNVTIILLQASNGDSQ
jgi:anti-sigma factor RsiW